MQSTDSELAKKVQLFLNSQRHGFRCLQVGVEGDAVQLAGTVGSFHARQLAVVLTKRVAGVRRVIDNLEVESDDRPERYESVA